MIKIIFTLFVLLMFFSCGPSQEELERQQRIEDSIMEIERAAIIERANILLEGTAEKDTVDSLSEAIEEND